MHVADSILQEVEDNKIVDIFSESDKTKVFLQLKQLGLIRVSENGVRITEEGKKALDLGIRKYFVEKRKNQLAEPSPDEICEKAASTLELRNASVAIPAALLFFLLFLVIFMIF